MFKGVKGNRDLNKKNLLSITKSIANKNLLEANPIIVNENMEIIDGQHRLKVAQDNNLEIYYITIKGTYLEDIHRLNTARKDWSNLDYITSYAKRGKQSYVKLLEFMQEYDIPAGIALVVLFNSRAGADYSRIKNGIFEVNDEQLELGHARYQLFLRVKPYFEKAQVSRTENLLYALNVVLEKEMDKLLEQNLSKLADKLQHRIRRVEYLRDFESVINWKRQTNLLRLF